MSENVVRTDVGTLQGDVKVDGTLEATGATTLSSTLAVTSAATLSSTLVVNGETTCAGIRNSDVTTSDATDTAIDLTSVTADHKLVTTGTLEAAIKLPQATASNIGMVINVFIGASTKNDSSPVIAVANSGSTVFVGGYTTCLATGGGSATESTSIGITADAKRIVLDSDNVATAGGVKGSHYTFTYTAADQIFVSGLGLVSGTEATAPGVAGSTTVGFS